MTFYCIFSLAAGICGLLLSGIIVFDLRIIRDMSETAGNVYKGVLIVLLGLSGPAYVNSIYFSRLFSRFE